MDLSIYHSCDTSSREEQAWEETTAVQRWQQPTSSFPSFLPIAIESDRIRRGFTSRLRPGAVGDGRFPEKMAVTSRDALLVSASQCRGCVSLLTLSHWGRGGLETGDYMLGTFRAHVHLSHNVTGG